MSFLKNLGDFIKTVAPVVITGASVNNWINIKQNEISLEHSRISGLINIADEVGAMDGETWKVLSAGLELKAIHSHEFEFLRNYCNLVVHTEVGKFKQLLSMSISESSILISGTFNRSTIEEQCIYLGLLKSRSTDIKASHLLNHLIDTSRSSSKTNQGYIEQKHKPNSSGFFNRVWLEVNTSLNNQRGMNIHADFEISNSYNQNCRLIAWLFYSNGQRVEDTNSKYVTSDGQVSTSISFIPKYDASHFEDLSFFIPYSELHINNKGNHSLKFYVGMFSEYDQITTSDYVFFSYNVS